MPGEAPWIVATAEALGNADKSQQDFRPQQLMRDYARVRTGRL